MQPDTPSQREPHRNELTRISAAAWDGVVAPDRRTPMERHIWSRACAEAFSAPDRVHVAFVGPPDRPMAIAPLAEVPRQSALVLLGAEDLFESGEVSYADDPSLAALARALVRIGRPIYFGRYPADSPFVAALRRASRGRGIVVARRLAVRAMPSIELDDSWREPEAHFSSGRRSDLRRMRRLAEAMGPVEIDVVIPRPAELGALLDEAFAVERMSWKGRAGTAIATDQRLDRFFRRYAELALEDGVLRLAFLRIGGVAAAMQIAVEQDERFWLLKVGYDEAYARCSPGNLLVLETIRRAAERGLRSYEFLGTEADWTRAWTVQARSVVALRLYPVSVGSVLLFVRDGAGYLRSRLARRLARRSRSSRA